MVYAGTYTSIYIWGYTLFSQKNLENIVGGIIYSKITILVQLFLTKNIYMFFVKRYAVQGDTYICHILNSFFPTKKAVC